jgi:cyclophilin family peptidyl-prolyl cis-trans isomerase
MTQAMRRRILIAFALILTAVACRSSVPVAESAFPSQDPKAKVEDAPVVVIDTSMGKITVQLDRSKAPITVDNFLKYVDKGFYDGLVFHRVITGFMIQGGGFEDLNGTLQEKTEGALPPIKNESKTGLSNKPGTIAMARTGEVDSATSQFFINHGDNANLDHYMGGYTAFGTVLEGLDVVDAIAKMQTTVKKDKYGNPMEDVPVKPIRINSIKRKS